MGGALGTGGAVEAPSVNDPLPPAEKDDSGANDDAPSKATGKRKATDDADQAQEEEEEEEDDLAVAFTVLDLSRVIFERILGTSASQPASSKDAASRTKHDVQLVTLTGDKLDERDLVIELGEVYNDLGDVGLESGMCAWFTQKTLSKRPKTMRRLCAFSRLYSFPFPAVFQMPICGWVWRLSSTLTMNGEAKLFPILSRHCMCFSDALWSWRRKKSPRWRESSCQSGTIWPPWTVTSVSARSAM